MADSSTTGSLILDPFAGGCWARRQLRNGIRYVPVSSKLRNSLSSVEGVLGIKLAIFYSTVDCSTTARRILILFAGGCWARRQLRNGIRYVPVASKLRNSMTLVRVVFTGSTLAILELNGRFLYDQCSDSRSDCERLLGSMPASQ